MNALTARLANALEHLAYPPIRHLQGCEICKLKYPARKAKMPPSVILTPSRLVKREDQIRQQRVMAGPEEPVHDIFRYRELENLVPKPPENS